MKHSECHPLTGFAGYPILSWRICKWAVFFSFWWR